MADIASADGIATMLHTQRFGLGFDVVLHAATLLATVAYFRRDVWALATGLFSTVAVTPERTGENAGDGLEYATILVEQDAGPPRTLAASAGYGTGQGFRVEGSWTHRNPFPPEGGPR